jgi:hypothetical protein
MNTPFLAAVADSWLTYTGTPESVLGPSHGWVPPLGEYRIASLHLRSHALWLFGAVVGLPGAASANGERNGVRKFNLALHVSLNRLVNMQGAPELDGSLDDSMHSFEMASPVSVSIERTEEPLHPGSTHRILLVRGQAKHLNFIAYASSVDAFGGKHAAKRFAEAFYLRD